MIAGFEMFLVVAEELNISKAAQKVFVTQQCASDHIRKLEDQFGVKLFNRKPRLSLTAAGIVVQNNLLQMKAMEAAMKERLNEIKGEATGQIRMGLNATRARILLPNVLVQYCNVFPNVQTSFVMNDTNILEQLLLKNEIDIFLGVNTSVTNPAFLRRELTKEDIYFLARADFFSKKTGISGDSIHKLLESGVELSRIRGFPIVRNQKNSTINDLVDRYLMQCNVTLNSLTYIGDYDIQIALCGSGFAAAFCPDIVLHRVMDYNKFRADSERILAFPVVDIKEKLRIDIVTSMVIPMPQYMNTFIDCLCREVLLKNNMSRKFQAEDRNINL